MNIHEYQTKELLRGYGVPVPNGRVAHNVDMPLLTSPKGRNLICFAVTKNNKYLRRNKIKIPICIN